MKGGQQPRRLTQPPLGPVARHRPADPPRGREPQADQIRAIGAIARLGRNRAGRAGLGLGRGQEIRSFSQAFEDGAPVRWTDQAVRRLRPLARRRPITLWPFLVAMRERKPWRRLRTSLDG
jgi:hypothetical protein